MIILVHSNIFNNRTISYPNDYTIYLDLIIGRVEVSTPTNTNNFDSDVWRPVCGDGWGVREAMVSEQLFLLLTKIH